MKKSLILLIASSILALMPILSYSQSYLPKKIVVSEDTLIAVKPIYIYAINRSLLKLQLIRQENSLLSAKLLNTSQLLSLSSEMAKLERVKADNLEMQLGEKSRLWVLEKEKMVKENRVKNRKRFLLGGLVGAVAVLVVGLVI